MLDLYSWQQMCVLIASLIIVLSGIALLLYREFLNPHTRHAYVRPWKLDILHIGIVLWVLAVSVLVAQSLANYYLKHSTAAPMAEETIIKTLIFSLALQGPILLCGLYAVGSNLWGFRDGAAPQSLSLKQISIEGSLYFLMATPIVLLTSRGWMSILMLAQQLGFPIEAPAQPLVKLLPALMGSPLMIPFVLIVVVIAPCAEELLFRATLYRLLASFAPKRWALILSAFVFASSHANLQSFLPLMVLGVLLVQSYERSGHLGVPIVLHSLFNLVGLLGVLFVPEMVQDI